VPDGGPKLVGDPKPLAASFPGNAEFSVCQARDGQLPHGVLGTGRILAPAELQQSTCLPSGHRAVVPGNQLDECAGPVVQCPYYVSDLDRISQGDGDPTHELPSENFRAG
jgi:hypothetical protein